MVLYSDLPSVGVNVICSLCYNEQCEKWHELYLIVIKSLSFDIFSFSHIIVKQEAVFPFYIETAYTVDSRYLKVEGTL